MKSTVALLAFSAFALSTAQQTREWFVAENNAESDCAAPNVPTFGRSNRDPVEAACSKVRKTFSLQRDRIKNFFRPNNFQVVGKDEVCLCFHPDHEMVVGKRSRGTPSFPDFVFRCGICEWKPKHY